MKGDKDHAEAFFWRLAGPKAKPIRINRGGKEIEILTGTDPAGNTITYRPVSKGGPGTSVYDGPPTVDIVENGKPTKLKFIK